MRFQRTPSSLSELVCTRYGNRPGSAAVTAAEGRVAFVRQNSARVARVKTCRCEVIGQVLDPRLVRDRGNGYGALAGGSVGSSPWAPCTRRSRFARCGTAASARMKLVTLVFSAGRYVQVDGLGTVVGLVKSLPLKPVASRGMRPLTVKELRVVLHRGEDRCSLASIFGGFPHGVRCSPEQAAPAREKRVHAGSTDDRLVRNGQLGRVPDERPGCGPPSPPWNEISSSNAQPCSRSES